jgi:hypothetical protein
MRTLLSVLGSLIAVAGTVPYIIETIRGHTKPRIVTWLTWALLTGVAGAASLSAGQLGAAVFALLGTIATTSVVLTGLRYGDRSFTTLDLGCLAGVFVGLLLWLSLDNPVFAVWAAILIDFAGLVPTLVHAWKQPAAETASAFVCVGLGGLITSAAIASGGSFSVAGLGYPLYAAVSMGTVATIIVIRRKSVRHERDDLVASPPRVSSHEPAPTRPAADVPRIGIARPNLRRLRPMRSRLVPAPTGKLTDSRSRTVIGAGGKTDSSATAGDTTSSPDSALAQPTSGGGRRVPRAVRPGYRSRNGGKGTRRVVRSRRVGRRPPRPRPAAASDVPPPPPISDVPSSGEPIMNIPEQPVGAGRFDSTSERRLRARRKQPRAA